MAIYTLCKRRTRWIVLSNDKVLLNFDNYHEAVETTRSALNLLRTMHFMAGTEVPDSKGEPSLKDCTV
jgi:hypothetical protein